MRRPHLRLIPDAPRRHRLFAAAALIVGAAVVAVLVLGIGGPGSPSPTEAATTVSGATTVQRRNLVATDTESGTVGYSGAQTVYDRLTGTITWLPGVGQVIKPGQALFEVDGNPVLLMDGTTPAYRDLSSADSNGPDVLELNRNLVALGFNAGAITVDDVWQPATTYGVELLQESLGETATGSLSLGQVVFLPGRQLVSAVQASLGSTGGGGGASPSGTSGASLAVDRPAPQFVSLTSSTPAPTGTAPATTATSPTTATTPASSRPSGHGPKQHGQHARQPQGSSPATSHQGTPNGRSPRSPTTTSAASGQTLAALSALLRAESAQLRAETQALRASHSNPPSNSPPHSSGNPGHSSGTPSSTSQNGAGGGGSASPVLQTSSPDLVVTVDLPASSQSEAHVGEHVTVQLPDGSTIGGKVTAVSAVAQTSSANNGNNGNGGSGGGPGASGGSSSTIPVTVTLEGHHRSAGLDQAAVSVNFVQQRARNVLSVPVTALLATSGGGYSVQEAAAPHRLIPVTTGLFAAGYVQISGAGIYPGLQVTDSQG
ncbi:MAG TPA: hypothetical protein VFN87_15775 [Solirubrobacteraceae bacterium]|nr:hypothetical protein [Solirubrobacteraceae bacterium]